MSVTRFKPGDTVYISITWRPSSGLSNVTAITLRLFDPQGNVQNLTPSYPSTNVSTGNYTLPDSCIPGKWTFRAEVSTGPAGIHEASFMVDPSAVPSP
jgi:uncharacterized protein YfaS (alpha-2-macroglobulin family)